jgi:hypothetical protein
MTNLEAKEVATRFVAAQELRGFTATCVDARKHERWPNEWSVIFDLHSSQGHLMDGPMVVIVDERTGEARLFESS